MGDRGLFYLPKHFFLSIQPRDLHESDTTFSAIVLVCRTNTGVSSLHPQPKDWTGKEQQLADYSLAMGIIVKHMMQFAPVGDKKLFPDPPAGNPVFLGSTIPSVITTSFFLSFFFYQI